jgi:hypothetical protein
VILGGGKQEPIFLSRPFNFSSTDLSAFLGAIPAVITSRRILVVEGSDDLSFDQTFYSWLCGPDVRVTGVGSCNDVRNAVKREGVWQQSGDAKICGVIDRDFRADGDIQSINDNGCLVLPYHEAESYLCYPSVLARAGHLAGHSVSESELIAILKQECETMLVRVSLQRMIAQSKITVLPIMTAAPWPKDFDDAKDEIKKMAQCAWTRADGLKNNWENYFVAEHERCKTAIDKQDIDAMLALFPGKELLKRMARRAGFRDQESLVNCVVWNLTAKDYDPLRTVIANLEDAMK